MSVDPVSPETDRAYRHAIVAARAALAAGDGGAVAARDALAEVVDVDELRRTVGALAFIAATLMPRAVRAGQRPSAVLDRLALEIAWRLP